MVRLESFQHKPKSGLVVKQKLHTVMPAVMEGVHGACKWIELHRLLDQHHRTVDAGPEVDRLTMQEDPRLCIEAKHPRAPNAAIIALTSAPSLPEHASSSFTPLGNCADSRADAPDCGDKRDGSGSGIDTRCAAGDETGIGTVSSIATTAMKADGASATLPLTTAFDCSRSRTHLCCLLAFTPAFRARPEAMLPALSRHRSAAACLPGRSCVCLQHQLGSPARAKSSSHS